MIGITLETVRETQNDRRRSENREELVKRLWQSGHRQRMEMVKRHAPSSSATVGPSSEIS